MSLSAVSSAIITIGKLLADEAKYLWGVEDEVERLQMELSWMQCFLSLKDADVRQDDDRRIRMWVSEIRELAYDAEDVVETFALRIKSKRKRGFSAALKRSAGILKEAPLLHETRSKIEKILSRITDSTRRLQTYGIKELTDVHRASASNVRRELRQSHPYIEEDNIVGLTNEIKDVVKLMTNDCQCKIKSICGMGGLGKTTLAKKVFNHKDVRKEFDHFAWVYVSQQFQKRKVWEQILSGFDKMNKELSRKNDEDVAKELFDFMKGKKCLVILDDVWNVQDWNLLNVLNAFPTKESQSKILLTSRNSEVAQAANDGRSCCIYELKFLNEDYSWELFQKTVFRNISPDPTEYSKLQVFRKGMFKRSAGLPLAIILLRGIFAKYSSKEWQKVYQHIESYLKRNTDQRMEDVLALSFTDLPSYLRPCFLYLSIFPEDYEIPVDRLIQLWIAEGFVLSDHDGEEFLENVAECYLIELVERFMVGVGRRDEATSKIQTCRMHDLMRDLCLSKAKQENFVHFMDGNSSYDNRSSRTFRRIAANGCPQLGIKGCNNLRSILLFDYGMFEDRDECCNGFMIRRVFKLLGSSSWEWESLFKYSKLIRVVNFEGGSLFKSLLLSDICNLVHLRLLSFRDLKIGENVDLPSSLRNLTCLLGFKGW